jgi:hypothetical protein
MTALSTPAAPQTPLRKEPPRAPEPEIPAKTVEAAAGERGAGLPGRSAPGSEPEAVADAERPRVYAKTRFVWIRERPSWDSRWLGYLWYGGSVPLASTTPYYARGCEVWYKVLPRGFVCVDGGRATLDGGDPDFLAVRERAPDTSSPWPHRYAESLGAERYEHLPDGREQRAREPDLEAHLALLRAAREGRPLDPTLAGIDLSPAMDDAVAFSSLPRDIQIQRNSLRRDSTLAYVGEYRHDDRSFLLTSDFVWVPKDRTRPYAPVTFHGVELDGAVKLPIAFFRETDKPAFRREGPAGEMQKVPETFSRLSMVELTGREAEGRGTRYLETRRDGLWVVASDAVVPKISERTPWGAEVGGPDTHPDRPPGRATWVDASIYEGWLVAYEGTRPVYATLIAPGRGGAPHHAKTPIETASTPIGRFNVTGKFVTATMDGPGDIVHSDVPWTQNFSGPYAIHAAYWHDAWGERVSGGCLNVSPIDGKWLFEFSEPRLPTGWYGVRWDPGSEGSTIVMVHR